MRFLLQAKQDIQKFIDKFGQQNYDKFVKNKQRLSSKGQSADILFYVKNYDVDQLNQLLDDIENRVVKDKSGKTKNNVIKVAENDNYIVYDVLDWQTSMNLGDETIWCISGRYDLKQDELPVKPSQAKQYFDSYKQQRGVQFYLFCMPKKQGLQKYCIVVYDEDEYEVWDSSDRDLGQFVPDQIPSINYKGFEHQQIVLKDSSNLKIFGATLLSVEEAKQLPIKLRKYTSWWWLRSPGEYFGYVAYVSRDGTVFDNGFFVDCRSLSVRPALQISNLESSNLKIGDRFKFGGKPFQIISNDLAFCLSDIGRHCFRQDDEAKDANDYEKSDVKNRIDNWFKEENWFHNYYSKKL